MCIGARSGLAGAYHLWLKEEEGKKDQGKLGDVINEDLHFNFSLDMAEDGDKWRKILCDANRQRFKPLKGKKWR